jgi:hypothetical protein
MSASFARAVCVRLENEDTAALFREANNNRKAAGNAGDRPNVNKLSKQGRHCERKRSNPAQNMLVWIASALSASQ